MSDERAPEAPRDERLTAEELEAIRAQANALQGFGHPPTHEEWEIITRLSRSDSRRLVIPLLADRDALAVENAELRAALRRTEDVPWLNRIIVAALRDTTDAHGYPLTREYFPSAAKRIANQLAAQCRDDARAALTGRADGGEV